MSADLEFSHHSGFTMARDAAEQHVTTGLEANAPGCLLVGQCLKREVVDAVDTEVVVDGPLVAEHEGRIAADVDQSR